MDESQNHDHPKFSQPQQTGIKMRARIIIPVWGAKYLARFDAACLPAVLSPGNLPYLSEYFDCELVVVTQTCLFDMVRSLPSVKAAERFCSLQLVAIDDMLSHPSYYGLTITHALYRGFTSLGDSAKDVWCLFLNADFILADGSYRTLVKHMLAGERCILAPSYCAIEENVRPILNQRAADNNGVLAMSPREMSGLVLDNMHFTIRAKIVNWHMFRIDRVDQFYYLLDNDTLLGRQLPIAVVAFRPECVPLEPATFWDYGVVSEVCPTSKLCILGDSDDFMMLELRGHNTMSEQFRLGWIDKYEIARDLAIWTTKDQRDCGEFPLVLHRNNLPPNYADGLKKLDDYYRNVMRLVTGPPRDHRNHYIWTGMVKLHQEWLRSRNANCIAAPSHKKDCQSDMAATGQSTQELRPLDRLKSFARDFFRSGEINVYRQLFDIMRDIYLALFGRIPNVGPMHPYWCDLHPVIRDIRRYSHGETRALAIWSVSGAAIAPHMSNWANEVVNSNPDEILDGTALNELSARAPYDLCLLELAQDDFMRFSQFHLRLRPLMKKGGVILAFYHRKGDERIMERDFKLISNGMPVCDLGKLHIEGKRLAFWAQQLWEYGRAGTKSGRIADLVKLAFIAALVIPLTITANRQSRKPSVFTKACTSLCLHVRII